MELAILPFEESKEIKELGFDWPCREHYSYGDGDKNPPPQGHTYKGGFVDTYGRDKSYSNSELQCVWNPPYGNFTAPEQSLVVKWFRDVHNIHIWIGMHEFKKWTFAIQKIDEPMEIYPLIANPHEWSINDYDSFEKAELEGIKDAIKQLKENEKN